ncbi:MAG: (Fe-S)-binding protein [Nitrososphaerota archaeon]|nr:(Fe-S)-binding protein [Nitrososphaerota archaeon]
MKFKLDEYRALATKQEGYEEAAKRFYDEVDRVSKNRWKIIKTSLDLCSRCGACSEECPYYNVTREEIYNPIYRVNLLRELYSRNYGVFGRLRRSLGRNRVSPEEIQALSENLYRCTMCRRCSLFCTFKVDNSLIVREGRVILSNLGIAPREIDEGVRMQLSVGTVTGMTRDGFLDIINFMKEEIKEKKGKSIDIPIDRKGVEMLLLHNSGDYLSFMEDVMGITEVLEAAGASWTLNTEFNEAVNYGLYYSDDILLRILKKHLEVARKLEVKRIVIGECGHAYKALKIFKRLLPEESKDFEILSILQVTDDYIRRGKLNLDPTKNKEPVTLHDSCNFARMGGIIEEPRRILKACVMDFREMYPNREYNYCCGGGSGLGLITHNKFLEWRMKVAGRKKVDQIKATGAKIVASSCANCKIQFRELIRYYNLDCRYSGIHELVANALVYR